MYRKNISNPGCRILATDLRFIYLLTISFSFLSSFAPSFCVFWCFLRRFLIGNLYWKWNSLWHTMFMCCNWFLWLHINEKFVPNFLRHTLHHISEVFFVLWQWKSNQWMAKHHLKLIHQKKKHKNFAMKFHFTSSTAAPKCVCF